MNKHGFRTTRPLRTLALALVVAGCAPAPSIGQIGPPDLRPIEVAPEPLTQLHPKLRWMTEQKVRGIWIGDDLFEPYGDGPKTKAQAMVDAGFNVVRVKMQVNSDGTRSGTVDKTKPIDIKRDRSKSTDLETRLAANVQEARRVGLTLMIGWNYGTHHIEPYRKYRNFKGALHTYSTCPLDETYIAGQHIGRWATRIAQGGADAMVIDMEMYGSDNAWPEGACTCDHCFTTYVKEYAPQWETVYDQVAPETRGPWLTEHKANEHYSQFTAQRIEALYDGIRERCQQINPAFFFGVAPQLFHFPGVERGLGTPSVPCLIFNEHEYHSGPYRGSFLGTKIARESLPALFACGLWVAVQPPQMVADNALQALLYADGWWAWYGTALLNYIGPGAHKETLPYPYGRWGTSSASDYLNRIQAVHARVDDLLTQPKDQWPARRDGKILWLKAKIATIQAQIADNPTPELEKELAQFIADQERYMTYVRMGGY